MSEESALYLCPYCGAFVSAQSEVCSNCGKPLETEEDEEFEQNLDDLIAEGEDAKLLEPGTEPCPRCGEILTEGSSQCSVCGTVLENQDVVHPEVPTEDGTAFFLCSVCGAFINEEAEKCPNCGTSLLESDKPESEVKPDIDPIAEEVKDGLVITEDEPAIQKESTIEEKVLEELDNISSPDEFLSVINQITSESTHLTKDEDGEKDGLELPEIIDTDAIKMDTTLIKGPEDLVPTEGIQDLLDELIEETNRELEESEEQEITEIESLVPAEQEMFKEAMVMEDAEEPDADPETTPPSEDMEVFKEAMVMEDAEEPDADPEATPPSEDMEMFKEAMVMEGTEEPDAEPEATPPSEDMEMFKEAMVMEGTEEPEPVKAQSSEELKVFMEELAVDGSEDAKEPIPVAQEGDEEQIIGDEVDRLLERHISDPEPDDDPLELEATAGDTDITLFAEEMDSFFEELMVRVKDDLEDEIDVSEAIKKTLAVETIGEKVSDEVIFHSISEGDDVRLCGECGGFVSSKAKVCNICGIKLTSETLVVPTDIRKDILDELPGEVAEKTMKNVLGLLDDWESISDTVDDEMSTDISVCINCGAFISPDAKNCTVCGTKVEDIPDFAGTDINLAQEEILTVCPECGAFLKEDATKCNICSTEITTDMVIPTEKQELVSDQSYEDVLKRALGIKGQISEISTEDQSGEIYLCPDCGAFVSPENEKCFMCGASLIPDSGDKILELEKELADLSETSCPNCGSKLMLGADVCEVCGFSFIDDDQMLHELISFDEKTDISDDILDDMDLDLPSLDKKASIEDKPDMDMNEKVAKLRKAYEEGQISKDLYDMNLEKLKGLDEIEGLDELAEMSKSQTDVTSELDELLELAELELQEEHKTLDLGYKMVKLKEAFDNGNISKELYEKNIEVLKSQMEKTGADDPIPEDEAYDLGKELEGLLELDKIIYDEETKTMDISYKILKLKEAYETNNISKDLYEKNMEKIKGEVEESSLSVEKPTVDGGVSEEIEEPEELELDIDDMEIDEKPDLGDQLSKLREAYEIGNISKELYESNLRRFGEEVGSRLGTEIEGEYKEEESVLEPEAITDETLLEIEEIDTDTGENEEPPQYDEELELSEEYEEELEVAVEQPDDYDIFDDEMEDVAGTFEYVKPTMVRTTGIAKRRNPTPVELGIMMSLTTSLVYFALNAIAPGDSYPPYLIMLFGGILLFGLYLIITSKSPLIISDFRKSFILMIGGVIVAFILMHWYAGILTTDVGLTGQPGMDRLLLSSGILLIGIGLIYVRTGVRYTHLWMFGTLFLFLFAIGEFMFFDDWIYSAVKPPGLIVAGMGFSLIILSTIFLAYERSIQSSIESEIVRGDIDYLKKNYSSALKSYDLALSRSRAKLSEQPEAMRGLYHDVPWYSKGAALILVGKLAEGIKCLEMALTINPNNEIAWVSKGNAHSKLGEFPEALECFNKAIQANPKYQVAWNNKGNVLARQQEYIDALKCYNKAIKINPRYEDAWINKGYVLVKMGRQDLAERCINMMGDRIQLAASGARPQAA